MFCCLQRLTPVRADVTTILLFSLICEELDRPREGDEEEKSADTNDNEKDVAERRKIRGEILKLEF